MSFSKFAPLTARELYTNDAASPKPTLRERLETMPLSALLFFALKTQGFLGHRLASTDN